MQEQQKYTQFFHHHHHRLVHVCIYGDNTRRHGTYKCGLEHAYYIYVPHAFHNSVFKGTAMEIIITIIIIKQSKQKSFQFVCRLCVCVLCVSMNGKATPLKNDDFDAFCVGFSTRMNADDTIPILNYIKVLYKLRFSYIQHQLEFRYVSDKSWLRLARVIIFLYILLCKEKEEDKKKNIYPYTDKNKILQEKKYLNIHGKKYENNEK